MLITLSTGKGQTLCSKGKVKHVSNANFHFAALAQDDEFADFPANSIRIHPTDNIQIQADLKDQVQERRNLEGGCFISKFKVAAPHTPLPSARIIGNCIIGIHLSN